MMEIFKRWFWKQDNDCSQDSDDDAKLRAYILLGVDADNDTFVACEFEDGEQFNISRILCMLFTGGFMEETIQSLKQACDTEIEAQAIIQDLMAQLAETHAVQQKQQQPSQAVVDPMDVFRAGGKR